MVFARGGMGSGKWYRWNKRTTCEEVKRIDIRIMKKYGWLQPGWRRQMSWHCGDEPTGDINYQVDDSSRVTLLSIQSVAIKLGRSIGLVAIGFISDSAGVQAAWYIAAGIFFCNLFLYLAVNYWMLRITHKRAILVTTQV